LLFRFLRLTAAVLWRLGYQVDRRLRLRPQGNIQFKTPLLGIGSCLSGGAGKTPLTIFIARECSRRGLRVAILCRPTGDEERLLAQYAGVPVFAVRSRLEACRCLDGDFDLLLCDDGLEDRRLVHARWIRLDWGESASHWRDLLPCGPCRSLVADHPEVAWTLRCASVGDGVEACADVVFATGMPRNFLGECPQGPVVAVAGIARPERFFEGLRRLGVFVETCVARPDHDRRFLEALRPWLAQGCRVAITAKDAVRLPVDFLRDENLFVSDVEVVRCAWNVDVLLAI